jgi:hypothetical protein
MTVQTLAEVDYCNMGLSHLGITTQIQSINPPDATEQAKLSAFWYPKSRDMLLKAAPWDFAYTSVVLASDASVAGPAGTLGTTVAFPGYRYAYVYPNDCLQAVAVTTYAGQRAGASFWCAYWLPSYGLNYSLPKIPYKIVQSQANPGQKMIVCDIQSTSSSPLYLLYIQGVTNTGLFDPMFGDALGFDMGWRLGMGLRSANPQKVQYCQQVAKQMRLEALAQVLNQAQQDHERDSPSVQARW